MRVIDLTHTIKEDMPVYPGTGTPKLLPANSYEENGFKETLVSFYSHTGTHVTRRRTCLRTGRRSMRLRRSSFSERRL